MGLRLQKFSFRCALFVLLGLIGGCTYYVPRESMTTVPLLSQNETKLPIKVQLLITEENSNYIFSGRPESLMSSAYKRNFPLGKRLEEISLYVFPQLFAEVNLVRNKSDDKNKDEYRIVEPTISDFHFRFVQDSLFSGFPVCSVTAKITVIENNSVILERSDKFNDIPASKEQGCEYEVINTAIRRLGIDIYRDLKLRILEKELKSKQSE